MAVFSIFKNNREVVPVGTLDLATLINRIKSDEWRERVESVRAFKRQGDKASADVAKRDLPAVSLSCELKTRSAKVVLDDKLVAHSGYLQVDLDGSSNPSLVSSGVALQLLQDEHVQAMFRSPSGDGYKLVVRVPANAALHKRSFDAVEKYFAERGFVVDKATKDLSRLCFVSWDVDAFLRDGDAVMFQPSAEVVHTKTFFPPSSNEEADVKEALMFIPSHPDYDDWIRICSAVWNTIGEVAGTALLKSWSPEDKDGEYALKYPFRLKEVGIGSLVYFAKQYGYDAVLAARRAKFGARVYFGGVEVPRKVAECRVGEIVSADKVNVFSLEDVSVFVEEGQMGMARLFAQICKDKWKYDTKLEMWREYCGGVWERDEAGTVRIEFSATMVKQLGDFVDLIKKDMVAKPCPEGMNDARDGLMGRVGGLIKKCRELTFITKVLNLAGSMMAVGAEMFDCKPMLLACGNGVIDLELNDFREHRASDMLTKKIQANFDVAASCPHFEKFVNNIFCGNEELVAYVQRLVGYCLSGSCNENCLFFFYGRGANGKSILRSAIEMLLGVLKTEISISSLLTNASDSNVDYQKSRLKGARVAFTDEIPSSKRFNAGQIKAMTGSDTILARNPYERPYSFTPTHKLILIGNDQPMVSEMDHGTWRRINVVPFLRQFSKEEQIPASQFAEWFHEEMSGILNWALVGWIEYQKQGLNPPDDVKLATSEYRDENDQLGQFVAECLVATEGDKIKVLDVFKSYSLWCEDNGLHAAILTKNKMTVELKNRGFKLAQMGKNISYILDYSKCEMG